MSLLTSAGLIRPKEPGNTIAGWDLAISLTLAALGFFACVYAASALPSTFCQSFRTQNVWFDGDCWMYADAMTNRLGLYQGTRVHPLLNFLLYIPTFILRTIGLANAQAVLAIIGILAAAWVAGWYCLARLVGCREVESALVAVLAGSCGGVTVAFPLPEAHAWAGLSLLASLILVVRYPNRVGIVWHVGIGIISASAIITNWTLGALISWKRLPRLRALKVIAITGVTMLGLSVIQKAIFPNAALILTGTHQWSENYSYVPSPQRIYEASRAFWMHAAVLPTVGTTDTFRRDQKFFIGPGQWPHPYLSVQRSALAFPTIIGAVALAGWLLLIGLGAWAWWHQLTQPFLGWALLAQFSLFLVFGTETILYAPSWLPYLLALIVFAAAFWPRRFILPVLVVVVTCMLAHNARTFAVAADMVVHPDDYPDLMYHLDRSIPPAETP